MDEGAIFQLAERPAMKVLRVGAERQPVVVIDSVLRNPQAMVDFAAERLSFGEDGVEGGAYPGIGAPAPLDYARPLAGVLDRTIRDVFGIGDAALTQARCRMSLVTRPPSELIPLQRIPHIDTTDDRQFALLHYFCAESFGGTAFFRHRATGYETVGVDRAQQYRAVREDELRDTPPPAAYFDRDTATYERIGEVAAHFNRLVIYRSCLLHSGLIGNIGRLSDDPRHGRLTANIFLTYAQP